MTDTYRERSATSLVGLSVCVVACHLSPETTGSAPYNSLLIDTLSNAGARVEVVAGVPHYPQWKLQDTRYRWGARWHETLADRPGVHVTRVRHAVPATPNVFGRARIESSFALMSAPVIARSRADLLIAVTPLLGAVLGSVLARRGRRTGVIVHDLIGTGAHQSGSASKRVAAGIARAEYFLLRKADRVGVITPRFVDPLIDHGIERSKIVDLPIFSHVERTGTSQADARRSLGWPDTARVTVLHTGNMGMKQGLDHLLAAARLAHKIDAKFDFVLLGGGNMRRQLEVDGADLPNVRFVDPVSESQYPLTLAAADVLLVHERPGVHEMSLPSKLTSYVTAERPILAAVESGGITGSLLHSYDAALTVLPGNARALVDGVDRLANDASLCHRLVDGARSLGASEFSEVSGRNAFVNFVAELASTRGVSES